MALKQIMLRKQIEKKKAELAALIEKDEDFKTREAEIEASIDEAQTDEEQAAVAEAVVAFEAEKEQHDADKEGLQNEIDGLEADLAEAEAEPAPVVERGVKIKNERKIEMVDVNIRALPARVRV